jgi:VWFA-related protein
MMRRQQAAVAAALVCAWAAVLEPFSQPRGASVTVHAVVERGEPVVGPNQVVPWKLVTGLARQDFEIVSDGETQAIESFSTDDTPIAIVVLLDLSASPEIKIDSLREPVEKYLIPALRPGDRVSFGRFGGTGLRLDGRFAEERRALLTAARELLAARGRRSAPAPSAAPDTAGAASQPTVAIPRPDPVIQVEASNGAFGLGASPAWDAVDAGATLLEAQPGRRAIVLVTDGRSSGNVHSLDDAILHAAAADVSVSIVGEAQAEIIPQDGKRWAIVRPAVFLQSMAEMTGGGYADVFGPEKGRPPLFEDGAIKRWVGGVLAHLVEDLHNTYALSFVPPLPDGRVHNLEVRVKTPGLKVRARRGYLAVESQNSAFTPIACPVSQSPMWQPVRRAATAGTSSGRCGSSPGRGRR